MKKITLNKELKLTKDSIAKLQESQMAAIKGGTDPVDGSSGPKCTCSSGDTCKAADES